MASTQSHITHKITADPALGVCRDLFIRVQYTTQEASYSSTALPPIHPQHIFAAGGRLRWGGGRILQWCSFRRFFHPGISEFSHRQTGLLKYTAGYKQSVL